MIRVSLQERGSEILTREQFGVLSRQTEFWELVQRRILALSFDGGRRPVLSAAGFIGRARLEGAEIDIVEKIPGSVQSLIQHASEARFKRTLASGISTDSGMLVRVLVRMFLDLLEAEVSKGIPKSYVSRSREASLVAGRLNMTRSILLKARGLGHKLAFWRQELTADISFNRVMLAALREIETLFSLALVTETETHRSRRLSLLFSESRALISLYGFRTISAHAAADLAAAETQMQKKQLLELSFSILLHQSVEGDVASGRSLPNSWFFSLERLFEVAVRQTLAEILRPDAEVKDGNSHSRPITAPNNRFFAHPDIVVQCCEAVAIGDVKFKNWVETEIPSLGDFYQLFSHSVAFNAVVGFFIYAGESFASQELGISVDGRRMVAFRVGMRSLRSDLTIVASRLLPAVTQGRDARVN